VSNFFEKFSIDSSITRSQQIATALFRIIYLNQAQQNGDDHRLINFIYDGILAAYELMHQPSVHDNF